MEFVDQEGLISRFAREVFAQAWNDPLWAVQRLAAKFGTPNAETATGQVAVVRTLQQITEVMVAGTATEGYSGGPSFRLLPSGELDDHVVGLMRGRPIQSEIDAANLQDTFIIFAATSFSINESGRRNEGGVGGAALEE